MSTQPIARRRMRVARRPDLRRTLSIGIAFALTFILAYAIGHGKGGAAVREHLPPSVPSVTTPVPAVLGTAPPIEVGVLKPPPPPVTQVKQTPPPALSAAPVTSAPVVTSPAPEAKAPVEPVHTTSAPPARSSPPTSSHSGGGTSFESSG